MTILRLLDLISVILLNFTTKSLLTFHIFYIKLKLVVPLDSCLSWFIVSWSNMSQVLLLGSVMF
jgi:hypothetical protein